MVGVTDGVLERIERYIETHPGASAVEVLAQVGADPTKYRDTVEALLAGDDVEEDEDPDVDDQKNIRDHPPAWSSWASADFTDPNSGVWPEEWLEREQWRDLHDFDGYRRGCQRGQSPRRGVAEGRPGGHHRQRPDRLAVRQRRLRHDHAGPRGRRRALAPRSRAAGEATRLKWARASGRGAKVHARSWRPPSTDVARRHERPEPRGRRVPDRRPGGRLGAPDVPRRSGARRALERERRRDERRRLNRPRRRGLGEGGPQRGRCDRVRRHRRHVRRVGIGDDEDGVDQGSRNQRPQILMI